MMDLPPNMKLDDWLSLAKEIKAKTHTLKWPAMPSWIFAARDGQPLLAVVPPVPALVMACAILRSAGVDEMVLMVDCALRLGTTDDLQDFLKGEDVGYCGDAVVCYRVTSKRDSHVRILAYREEAGSLEWVGWPEGVSPQADLLGIQKDLADIMVAPTACATLKEMAEQCGLEAERHLYDTVRAAMDILRTLKCKITDIRGFEQPWVLFRTEPSKN